MQNMNSAHTKSISRGVFLLAFYIVEIPRHIEFTPLEIQFIGLCLPNWTIRRVVRRASPRLSKDATMELGSSGNDSYYLQALTTQ